METRQIKAKIRFGQMFPELNRENLHAWDFIFSVCAALAVLLSVFMVYGDILGIHYICILFVMNSLAPLFLVSI